jgi:CheY-like chemotaxis protein
MEPQRKAILCLCYDTNMLQIRRMLLEHFGYRVLPTTSVEAAKSLARDECPDMLLLDNSHPEIDFEQVALQVKQSCPRMLTVVLSPYYHGRKQTNGVIDRFVPKDDGPGVLISQIEELFGDGVSGGDTASRPM